MILSLAIRRAADRDVTKLKDFEKCYLIALVEIAELNEKMRELNKKEPPPDTLADAARRLGMRVETCAGVEAALRSLTRLAYEVAPRILITGSLYLAGHVLAEARYMGRYERK